ncbi:hypothetical protein SNEBB_008445 [Seison nebaliae]|nr:hypothetical protein SNEBB_008445 [Seison nebaliae]
MQDTKLINSSKLAREIIYPKSFDLLEETNKQNYSIKLHSSASALEECYVCKYLNIENCFRRTVYEKQTNWLPNEVLDIIFKWYLVERYEFYIPASRNRKKAICSVTVYPKWNSMYCNRSTEYSQFYCEKVDGYCHTNRKFVYVQNMRPISNKETHQYQRYFTNKYFFENSKKHFKVVEDNQTERNIQRKKRIKVPLCNTFYSGMRIENFYPNISHNDSIRNLYRIFMNDILSQGFYINNLWMFKHCTYFVNDGTTFENWYEFYENFTRVILNYSAESLENVKTIALNPYIRDQVKGRNILFIGDSTLRQFIHIFYKLFRLQIIQWVDAKAHTNIVARDIFGLHFNLTYQLHGPPIRHATDFDIHKDIEYYLKNIMTDYRNKQPIPHVIVINYDNHPAAVSYQYYMKRLQSLTAMVVQLLKEIPHIKVLYKGAGKQPRKHIGAQYLNTPYSSYMKQALELGTEYLQFMNSRFLYYLWLLLQHENEDVKRRFIFLNFYEMTELFCKADLHPCDNIVIQQFFFILHSL